MVGRTIHIDGRPVEVIGILPPRLAPWSDQHLFLPRLFETSTTLPENIQQGGSYLSVIGRLNEGVTLEQAQAELDGLAAEYSKQFAGRTDATNDTAAVNFVESLVANQRQTMTILLAAVAAVLLVACANASTLFLGRLLTRQRETAVRQALGASRAQIIGQFLLESLGLSVLAGLAGLAVAWTLLRAVATLLGSSLPAGTLLTLHSGALAIALATVAVTALLVGLIPAWYVTRPVNAPLLSFSRGDSGAPSGRRLRSILVCAEVVLSCVLLIGATLLLASLLRLQNGNPGFEIGGIAAGFVNLPPQRYPTSEGLAAFATGVVEKVKQAPGVRNAAAVFGLPLAGGYSFHQYVVAGRPIPPPSERARAGIRLVSEDYFSLMKIRLKAGRLFTARDRAGAPNVCIINESLARRLFASGDPLGQSILRGRDANLRYEIIGVVEDIRTYGLRRDPVDEVFYPIRQLPWPTFAVVAEAAGDAGGLRRTLENAVAEIDPAQALAQFATMEQTFDRTMGSEKAMASITVAFASIALFMAMVGLYAVLAQSVAARTTEIGVRVALGADRRRIIQLILRNGMAIVAIGVGVGVVTAALAGQYLTAQLYGVNPRDPWILGGVATLFSVVALVACLLPSWRAANLDPIQALRRV
jgi:putative ABC transport system permease protein